jgi:hypothetical protein
MQRSQPAPTAFTFLPPSLWLAVRQFCQTPVDLALFSLTSVDHVAVSKPQLTLNVLKLHCGLVNPLMCGLLLNELAPLLWRHLHRQLYPRPVGQVLQRGKKVALMHCSHESEDIASKIAAKAAHPLMGVADGCFLAALAQRAVSAATAAYVSAKILQDLAH